MKALGLIFLAISACFADDFTVEIESGAIIGETNDQFFAFRGIPYADPPVGKLRLRSPQKYSQKWSEVREFKKYGNHCSQYDHMEYSYIGDEDCLFLNVFVPKNVANSKKKVPVIFFIHGGAFMFGGGNFYMPDNIMKQQNMILVTLNYRLGILGFLSTEDSTIPGNFGLKDQAEALRWVKQNINAFNGDPGKVTIVGYSAGGASVHLHYMSSLSDGLFTNGISHSGNANDPWVMMENARDKAYQVAEFMKCSKDHKELLNCLREKPVRDLVMLSQKFQQFLYNPFSPFGVVVEPKSKSAFLTDSPMNILRSGEFQKLPWMLSQTQDEGLYPAAEFYNGVILKKINEQWNEIAPSILDYGEATTDAKKKLQISQNIRKAYLGDKEISKENFMAFDNILTDRLFKHGAFKSFQLQSGFSPSFFYHFRYKSLSGLAEFMSKSNDYIGISHGEDVMLIYGFLPRVPFTTEEETVSQNLITMYYNFAKNGKLAVPIYDKVEFPLTAKHDQILALEITNQVKVVKIDENFGNVAFWDDIENNIRSNDKNYKNEL